MPQMTKGTTRSEYGVDGVVMAANHVKPHRLEDPGRSRRGGFPPHRSARRPITGASNIAMAVHGSTRMPAAKGDSPCTV